MDLRIRPLEIFENELLHEMMYHAIYREDDAKPLDRNILNEPGIKIYYDNFFDKKDDYCFLATLDDMAIGAIWVRILNEEPKGYGFIDDATPELAIAVLDGYRGSGIGTKLIEKMANHLSRLGYKELSLSVSKKNPAYRLYLRLGFVIFEENKEDYLMVLKLI